MRYKVNHDLSPSRRTIRMKGVEVGIVFAGIRRIGLVLCDSFPP